MRCPISERHIYLLCDGLLQGKEKSDVQAHIQACGRCKKIHDEALRSLALIKRPAPEQFLLDRAATESVIDRAFANANRRPRIISLTTRRKTFAWLAAAAVLLLVLGSGIYLLRNVQKSGVEVSSAVRNVGAEIPLLTSAKDTLVMFNRMCAIHAGLNTRVSIDRRGPRVVYFNLDQGDVQIAAHKGLYDTIAVRCAPVTVFTTGTHFSVEKTGVEVLVSVVEGGVKLSNSQTNGWMLLSCGDRCIIHCETGAWERTAIPEVEQKQLTEQFESIASSDIALVPAPATGARQQRGDRLQKPALQKQGYDAIRGLIYRRDYDKAIIAIMQYLASASTDRDVAYCDLALCYSRTGRWESALDAYDKASAATEDSLVKEAVLHRSNSILFSKLVRYGQAEQGIKTYLARYPNGAWREREYGMLVKVQIAQQRREDAQRTAQRYMFEFPGSCSADKMLMEIAKIPADQSANRRLVPAR